MPTPFNESADFFPQILEHREATGPRSDRAQRPRSGAVGSILEGSGGVLGIRAERTWGPNSTPILPRPTYICGFGPRFFSPPPPHLPAKGD